MWLIANERPGHLSAFEGVSATILLPFTGIHWPPMARDVSNGQTGDLSWAGKLGRPVDIWVARPCLEVVASE